MIAFVCAMQMELRPLRRHLRLRRTDLGYAGRIGERAVIGIVTGIGTARARTATARLLHAVDIERVIVVGIAGAIENSTPIGTLVIPELVLDSADGSVYRPGPLGPGEAHGTIWTTDELVLDPAAHADLRARGVVALDMETAAIAGICETRCVPWSVVRAISDRAGDGSVDAQIAGLGRPDGRADIPAAIRYLLRHPGALPRLIRLAHGSTLAANRAAAAAVKAVDQQRG